MKIAVTYSNGEIFQHFGHTEEFKIYEVVDNKVIATSIEKSLEGGHSALATLLCDNGIDVLICGGISGGAKNALAENGIELFGGVSGDADQAVNNYLAGSLMYNPDVKCSHFEGHHGEEEHQHCHGADGCSHKC